MNRPDLAKVKYCGKLGLILIMERAKELDYKNMNWEKFKEEVYEKYKFDTLSDFMLGDSKPSNWGYIDSRLVKIDYGD
jgi:hypothetical protein